MFLSLQELLGEAPGGEQHVSDMQHCDPPVPPAAVHQLRPHHAGHRLQAGARPAGQ